jgi:hypothetical protein
MGNSKKIAIENYQKFQSVAHWSPNFKFIVEACKYPQKIGEVDFLIKILARMGELCTERLLESRKIVKFLRFHKKIVALWRPFST